jgi:hypothetical protein
VSAQVTANDVKVGRIFSAKRPSVSGDIFCPVYNDRQVVHVDALGLLVQYDSPAVKLGRHYPRVPMEKFLKWAGADVTDSCPDGGWRPVQGGAP